MKQLFEMSTDCSIHEWNGKCSLLTSAMNKMNPSSMWHCDVENFGWMKRSGYKDFKALDGSDLLTSILPKADCHFTVHVDYRSRVIKVNNFHHDNSTGNEWYTIKRNKKGN